MTKRVRGWRAAVLMFVVLVGGMTATSALDAAAETTLQTAIADVAKRYPRVLRISSDELSRATQADNVALFDVRSQAEYDVSHLRSAVRVDADTTAETFASRFGPSVSGKIVVFYCSVGSRSSRLADRLSAKLTALGVASVHNLSGGIFGWHNEARPVVDARGPTEFVHAFDNSWGRLVDQKDLTRTAPAP